MDDLGRRTLMLVVAAAVALGALPPSAAAAATPRLPSTTAVGIMVPRTVNATVPYTSAQVLAEAEAVGVDTVRIGQKVTEERNGYVRALSAGGQRLVLDVKAGEWPQEPPTTAGELEAYRGDLDRLLDQVEPALLAVENEETVDEFVTGTPDQYLGELRAAVDVGHRHGVPVTNGGIPFEILTLVVWNRLRTTEGTAVADRFLGTAADTPTRQLARDTARLRGTPASDPDPYARLGSATKRQAWKDAEALIEEYGTDPGDVGIDAFNFHWYATDEEGFRTTGAYTDADALRQAITVLEEMVDKPVITNEIRQWGDTAAAPEAYLQVLVAEQRLPLVVWFDADGIPATALHDFDPARRLAGDLRPNGVAFSRWLHAHPELVDGEVAEHRLAYVEAAYGDGLGRPSDTAGRLHWAVVVGTPAGRGRFGRALITSSGHDALAVDELYLQVLGRPSDPSGRAYWTAWLATHRREDLEVALLGSAELLARAGSTPSGFVDAAYRRVLEREADPAGRAYWSERATTAEGRRTVARALVWSTENRRREVDAEHRRLLDRPADGAALERWSAALVGPRASIDDLIAVLLASDEYRTAPR